MNQIPQSPQFVIHATGIVNQLLIDGAQHIGRLMSHVVHFIQLLPEEIQQHLNKETAIIVSTNAVAFIALHPLIKNLDKKFDKTQANPLSLKSRVLKNILLTGCILGGGLSAVNLLLAKNIPYNLNQYILGTILTTAILCHHLLKYVGKSLASGEIKSSVEEENKDPVAEENKDQNDPITNEISPIPLNHEPNVLEGDFEETESNPEEIDKKKEGDQPLDQESIEKKLLSENSSEKSASEGSSSDGLGKKSEPIDGEQTPPNTSKLRIGRNTSKTPVLDLDPNDLSKLYENNEEKTWRIAGVDLDGTGQVERGHDIWRLVNSQLKSKTKECVSANENIAARLTSLFTDVNTPICHDDGVGFEPQTEKEYQQYAQGNTWSNIASPGVNATLVVDFEGDQISDQNQNPDLDTTQDMNFPSTTINSKSTLTFNEPLLKIFSDHLKDNQNKGWLDYLLG